MKTIEKYLEGCGPVFVVYDNNVRAYAEKLLPGRPAPGSNAGGSNALETGTPGTGAGETGKNLPAFPALGIDANESDKTLQTVERICRWLLEQGADRDAIVVAVGGGVTTDMAGFAASIYKRGIKYANVPTTLLAQVDAAIGGKTGVNLDSYKNILGVINQPEFTFVSAEPLKTLPQKEFLSGAAEMLKTFIIGDAALYDRAVKLLKAIKDNTQEVSGKKLEELEFLISAAGAIKRRIVKIDPYEKGLRRVLNLGHTFGHAVEWYQHSHKTKVPMTHGEAVAAGIIRAAEISEAQGYCKHGLAKRLAKDFAACGLPTELPCRPDQLAAAIVKDKKAENGSINFVLIKDIGTVIVRKLTPAQL